MAGKPIEHGSSWRVRWSNPRVRGRRQSHTLPTKALARDFKRWLEAPGQDHLISDDDDIVTSGAWLHEAPASIDLGKTFLEFATEQIDSRTWTSEGYRDRLHARVRLHFADWHNVPMVSINRAMVLEKIAKFDSNIAIAETSAPSYIFFAAGLFRDAAAMKAIPSNPFEVSDSGIARRVSWGTKTGAKDVRKRTFEGIYLRQRTIDYLLEAASDHATELLLRLLLFTGLRIGEAFALRKSHLLIRYSEVLGEDGRCELAIRNAIVGDDAEAKVGLPKKGSYREVPITDELARELEAFTADLAQSEFIFRSPRQSKHRQERHWTYGSFYRNRWLKIRRRAWELGMDSEIKPTLHSFRHTFVSRLYEKDWPTWQISPLVGHETETVTAEIYGHLDKQKHASRAREQQAGFYKASRHLVRLDDDAS